MKKLIEKSISAKSKKKGLHDQQVIGVEQKKRFTSPLFLKVGHITPLGAKEKHQGAKAAKGRR